MHFLARFIVLLQIILKIHLCIWYVEANFFEFDNPGFSIDSRFRKNVFLPSFYIFHHRKSLMKTPIECLEIQKKCWENRTNTKKKSIIKLKAQVKKIKNHINILSESNTFHIKSKAIKMLSCKSFATLLDPPLVQFIRIYFLSNSLGLSLTRYYFQKVGKSEHDLLKKSDKKRYTVI